MSDKETWRETGTGLGHAFRDLGKTLINTGKKGVDHAVEWAGGDKENPNQPAPQQPGVPPQAPPPNLPNQAPQAQQPYTPQGDQAPYTPQPTPPQPAFDASMLIADEIKKLADLRDQGILTEEEFTARKRQLLGM